MKIANIIFSTQWDYCFNHDRSISVFPFLLLLSPKEYSQVMTVGSVS